jgi:Ni,Fe-hydrogenase III large subunit/Ni,Fe-hydrogenase III component G
MAVEQWLAACEALPGAPGVRFARISLEQWRAAAVDVAGASGRLAALWASADEHGRSAIYAAFWIERAALILSSRCADAESAYPGIEDLFPAAARMQRAVADLSGVHSTAADARPWLRHAAWPQTYRPLIDGPPTVSAAPGPGTAPAVGAAAAMDSYPFVRVEGDGVHEIAVGPVHAGTIEPGHFRFSVVGEKVLRLEERLGYVHKGIERRFAQLPILEGHRLAARVSGDSAVAFSWAYCQALEGISAAQVPERAVWLRALYLETERVANHLGDLGALGNDAGFAFGLAQFSRLKERLLRASEAALGARYLMEAIVPGGTRHDLAAPAARELSRCVREIATEVTTLREIYDEHEGLRDRFNGAGRASAELARRLGLIGLAGRASGQAFDLRTDLPCNPYGRIAPSKIGRTEGDVAARVAVRFEELQESCRLIHEIAGALPAGAHSGRVGAPAPDALGVGLIEGWRGPVLVALEAGPGGSIRRCHPHDPSWQNWPVLEHAIIDNIVPDFPLINKSFNLSYSGHDL